MDFTYSPFGSTDVKRGKYFNLILVSVYPHVPHEEYFYD